MRKKIEKMSQDIGGRDEEIKRLEFYISSSCYNNCIFCGEKDLLEDFKDQFVARVEVEKEIRKRAKEGFNFLVFTGGEPTLHPDIVEMSQLAKKLRYQVFVNSDGGKFSEEIFCQKAMSHIDRLSFSVYGHTAELHNLHTRNGKSFAILKKSLENVEKISAKTKISARILMTRHNFSKLPKIIDFISRYKKIEKILFSGLAPEGRALENYRNLVVPLDKVRKKIPLLAKLASRKSRRIKFFGLPLCVLGNVEERSSDSKWHHQITLKKIRRGGRTVLAETEGFKPLKGVMKPDKCLKCSKKDFCPGIFGKYYQEFGDGELAVCQ